MLGRRGFALESAAGRVCTEAGARVTTNQFVRDSDLGVPNANDNKRLEVVADGLPLFGGVQLAVDTTLVFAVRGDGESVPGAADRDGVALRRARRRKEATFPELIRAGESSFGGPGTGSGRPLVQRGSDVRPDAGESTREIRSSCVTASLGASVEVAVVLHLFVRGSQGVCSFLVGIPRWAWC